MFVGDLWKSFTWGEIGIVGIPQEIPLWGPQEPPRVSEDTRVESKTEKTAQGSSILLWLLLVLLLRSSYC